MTIKTIKRESLRWLRVMVVSVMAGVGFVLVLHDLDDPVTGFSWWESILVRLVGGALLYVTITATRWLVAHGQLPTLFTDEDEDEDEEPRPL